MIEIPGIAAPEPLRMPRPAAGPQGTGSDYDNMFK